MVDYKSRVLPGVLLTTTSAAIGAGAGSYIALGTLLHPARIVKFTNNTTQDVTVSWDGTNNHEYVPAGSFVLLDFTSNAVSGAPLSVNNSTVFYGKGTAGTGSFYISYYYAV